MVAGERLQDGRVVQVLAKSIEIKTGVHGHLLDHIDLVDVEAVLVPRVQQGGVKCVKAVLPSRGFRGPESEPAANALWSKIDKSVTDQSPMATLFTPKHIDFVSKRVGNFTFSKQFYWLVDQSWVQ